MVKLIILFSCLVAVSTAYQEYQCLFSSNTYYPNGNLYYTCEVHNVRIFNVLASVFSKESVGHDSKYKGIWDPYFENENFEDGDVRRLKFVSANMTEIPRTIFEKFMQLEVLEVIGCGLRNIFQHSFEDASHLNILMAHENELTSLFAYSFINAQHLEHLDLSSNQISRIDAMAFSGLEELKELSLAHNNLNLFDDKTFKSLVSLQSIWLNDNSLEILSVDLFASNVELRVVYLSNNKLTAISTLLFDQLPLLEFLFLADNPCVNKIYKSTFIAHNVNVKEDLASCYKEYKSIIPNEEHERKLHKVLNDVRAAEKTCETDRNTLSESLEEAESYLEVLLTLNHMTK